MYCTWTWTFLISEVFLWERVSAQNVASMSYSFVCGIFHVKTIANQLEYRSMLSLSCGEVVPCGASMSCRLPEIRGRPMSNKSISCSPVVSQRLADLFSAKDRLLGRCVCFSETLVKVRTDLFRWVKSPRSPTGQGNTPSKLAPGSRFQVPRPCSCTNSHRRWRNSTRRAHGTPIRLSPGPWHRTGDMFRATRSRLH